MFLYKNKKGEYKMRKIDYIKLSRIVGSLQAINFVLEKRYLDEKEYTLTKITELIRENIVELEDFIQESLEKEKK